MQLKERFHKIRAMREQIREPFVVIRSAATTDGGREGVLSQVSREIAASMIVDGRCTFANDTEREEFYRMDRESHEKQKAELMESRLRRELDFETLVGIRQRRGQK